jgi:GTP cyclohydrolase IA
MKTLNKKSLLLKLLKKVKKKSFEDEQDFNENDLNLPSNDSDNYLSEDQKIDLLEEKFREIFQILNLNLDDPSLQKSPRRIAKMYVKELFYGLDDKKYPRTYLLDHLDDDEMPTSGNIIFINNINLQSICEHHFMPITGFVHIAYIPQNKIIGLSKINRLVDFHAKKPQLQERLTKDILNDLSEMLQTPDVAVFSSATHLCVTFRGIKDKNSFTSCYQLKGKFKLEKHYRNEFLSQIPKQ